MSSSARQVPTKHTELTKAVANDVFPDERHWLDFKELLYPPPRASGKSKTRKEVHLELARDIASLAVRGGYLVFGVREDKQSHTFSVVEMELPVGLDQTVDQVAHDLITPDVDVIPTLVPNPADRSKGLMVVEVPESALAPHMVENVYYGRTTTGKYQMPDAEVERLIQRRGQISSLLQAAMRATVEADPLATAADRVSHFFLTALPTQPWPDMFLPYTGDMSARQAFTVRLGNEINIARSADADRDPNAKIAFEEIIYHRRSQRTPGAWFDTWPQSGGQFPGTERTVGIDEGGTVRYIDLNAGSLPNGLHRFAAAGATRGGAAALQPALGRKLVYASVMWWRTLDIVRLIGRLASDVNYAGSWLIGIEVDHLRGAHGSEATFAASTVRYDADTHQAHERVTTTELVTRPREVTSRLLRPLFRDLEAEQTMPPN